MTGAWCTLLSIQVSRNPWKPNITNLSPSYRSKRERQFYGVYCMYALSEPIQFSTPRHSRSVNKNLFLLPRSALVFPCRAEIIREQVTLTCFPLVPNRSKEEAFLIEPCPYVCGVGGSKWTLSRALI